MPRCAVGWDAPAEKQGPWPGDAAGAGGELLARRELVGWFVVVGRVLDSRWRMARDLRSLFLAPPGVSQVAGNQQRARWGCDTVLVIRKVVSAAVAFKVSTGTESPAAGNSSTPARKGYPKGTRPRGSTSTLSTRHAKPAFAIRLADSMAALGAVGVGGGHQPL